MDYTSNKEYKDLCGLLELNDVQDTIDFALSVYGMNQNTYDNLCEYYTGYSYQQLLDKEDQ